MKRTFAGWGVTVFAAAALVAMPAMAQNTGKQTPPIQLGTSGGSANDISRFFCCGGTLGSLVLIDGAASILSNNHVLARSGSAAAGEHIIQPGLIENGCSATGLNVVATYNGNLVPLGSGVDTAVATVVAGQVNATGSILGIGVPCNTTSAATVGMAVTKSGRTTGVTNGTVQALNVSATIQYETQCNAGRAFNESYTNQVMITPGTFSAGGDSGSLILSSTHHPVALLFAGSSQATIANPISAVANAYTSRGHTFSFVGQACTKEAVEINGLSSLDAEMTRVVKESHEANLFAHPGVLAVGVGKIDDEKRTTQPAILVWVEQGRMMPRNLPTELDGIPVRIIPTDPFVAR